MKKETLTDSQTKVLHLAHDKGRFTVQDLPIKGAACKKVLDSLLNKSLIKVIQQAKGEQEAFALTAQGQKAIRVGNAEEVQKPKVRPGSKLDQVIKLLRRTEGATIDQMMEQTGWQQHTVRGTLAGALKKRLGLTIASKKPDDGKRVYRITEGLETA